MLTGISDLGSDNLLNCLLVAVVFQWDQALNLELVLVKFALETEGSPVECVVITSQSIQGSWEWSANGVCVIENVKRFVDRWLGDSKTGEFVFKTGNIGGGFNFSIDLVAHIDNVVIAENLTAAWELALEKVIEVTSSLFDGFDILLVDPELVGFEGDIEVIFARAGDISVDVELELWVGLVTGVVAVDVVQAGGEGVAQSVGVSIVVGSKASGAKVEANIDSVIAVAESVARRIAASEFEFSVAVFKSSLDIIFVGTDVLLVEEIVAEDGWDGSWSASDGQTIWLDFAGD